MTSVKYYKNKTLDFSKSNKNSYCALKCIEKLNDVPAQIFTYHDFMEFLNAIGL